MPRLDAGIGKFTPPTMLVARSTAFGCGLGGLTKVRDAVEAPRAPSAALGMPAEAMKTACDETSRHDHEELVVFATTAMPR
jgi:hypothetical protein